MRRLTRLEQSLVALFGTSGVGQVAYHFVARQEKFLSSGLFSLEVAAWGLLVCLRGDRIPKRRDRADQLRRSALAIAWVVGFVGIWVLFSIDSEAYRLLWLLYTQGSMLALLAYVYIWRTSKTS